MVKMNMKKKASAVDDSMQIARIIQQAEQPSTNTRSLIKRIEPPVRSFMKSYTLISTGNVEQLIPTDIFMKMVKASNANNKLLYDIHPVAMTAKVIARLADMVKTVAQKYNVEVRDYRIDIPNGSYNTILIDQQVNDAEWAYLTKVHDEAITNNKIYDLEKKLASLVQVRNQLAQQVKLNAIAIDKTARSILDLEKTIK